MSRHPFLIAAVLAVALSCSSGPRVIPRKDLYRIYEEMFLSDKWLGINQEMRGVTDTALVYDPIFKKYGYTYDNYCHTVSKYMDSPDKFERLLKKLHSNFDKRKKNLMAKDVAVREEKQRREARMAPESNFPRYYGKDYSAVRTDTIAFERDTVWGVDIPVPKLRPHVRSFDTLAV